MIRYLRLAPQHAEALAMLSGLAQLPVRQKSWQKYLQAGIYQIYADDPNWGSNNLGKKEESFRWL